MKKIIFLTAACCIACLSGFAQTKQESIKELFHLMQQDSLMEKVVRTTVSAMALHAPAIAGQTSNAKELADMNADMEVAATIMKKFVHEDIIKIYDKNFTQEEIRDYIAFYKSSSGQKILTAFPAVQTETISLLVNYMPSIVDEIRKRADHTKKR